MSMPRTVICFGCDEAFMPLAKGLVLSLAREAGFAYELAFIDIGVSEDSRDWLRNQGATITVFDPARHIEGYGANAGVRYVPALLCRPFLPRILPGYEVYVWMDSDMWLQHAGTLRSFIAAASTGSGKLAIARTDHWIHGASADRAALLREDAVGWTASIYGPALAGTYSDRVLLNAGCFALAGGSPLWHLWRNELARIYADAERVQRMGPTNIHMSDQTTLNYLCHSRNCHVEFSSFHNYNCHLGSVERRNGEVRRLGDDLNRIGIVHLTTFRQLAKSYLDRELLFDGGRYLSEVERSALLARAA